MTNKLVRRACFHFETFSFSIFFFFFLISRCTIEILPKESENQLTFYHEIVATWIQNIEQRTSKLDGKLSLLNVLAEAAIRIRRVTAWLYSDAKN